ncbi:hypothetical protein SLNSH_20605 [Alsobacter soli]|uniref:Acyltransferase 3 domain-containing protein n=1 Tax=Alsobacter soli TaxID=2109933 RepID=A0A2T1HNC4_9HYPH|nr:hypothetical protein SLNSH_20605 [Alsobacter soli]
MNNLQDRYLNDAHKYDAHFIVAMVEGASTVVSALGIWPVVMRSQHSSGTGSLRERARMILAPETPRAMMAKHDAAGYSSPCSSQFSPEEMHAKLHHENNFDYIRLFAALQVLIFHSIYHLGIESPFWTNILSPFAGVPIFFVTSGFLITASYERKPTLLSYAHNRVLRIFPGLWACLAVTAAVVLYLGYEVWSVAGVQWFVLQLCAVIYTPKFLSGFGFGSYNGSLWTIPVELQFYATVPVLSYVVARTRRKDLTLAVALVFFLGLAVIIRGIAPSVMGIYDTTETLAGKLLRYCFFSHYYLFLIGALCWYLRLETTKILAGAAWAWLIVLAATHVVFRDATPIAVVVRQGVLAMFTLAVAHSYVRVNLLRGQDISYGVYLYHGLILNLVIEFGGGGDARWLYGVLGASLVAGWLSWALVEKRMRSRKFREGFRHA